MIYRKQFFIPGTFLVAFLIFSGRWGSHIGVSPLYLTDVIATGTIFSFCLLVYKRKNDVLTAINILKFNPLFLGTIILAIFAIFTLILRNPITLNGIRDFAPYGYAVLAPISIISFSVSTQLAKSNTLRVIWLALVLHLVWVCYALLLPEIVPPFTFGSSGLNIFTIRPDFDSAMIGVLLAFTCWRLVVSIGKRWINLFILFLSSFCLFPLNTRAGIISAFISLLIVLVFLVVRYGISELLKKSSTYLALLTILSGSILGGGLSTFWERISSTSISISMFSETTREDDVNAIEGNSAQNGKSTSSVSLSALGTANARFASWNTLENWMSESNNRFITGVGFGPNFLFESGAAEKLLGPNNPELQKVRSPHNYWLGTWSRIGIPGIILMTIVLFSWLAYGISFLRTSQSAKSSIVYFLLPASLIIPATFGVVLESPFGYVIWWWCLGAPLGNLVSIKIHSNQRN